MIKNLFGPVTKPTELFIKAQPLVFSLIIMYQGLFAPNAIAIPERLEKLFRNKVFRLVSLMAIAFGATGDIEYALASTVIFLSVMYLLKTPEERRTTGFI
tara:strand:- start:5264 stop:5563 length:300 start_codon:yes stop_codon:yes gene_type:complete